VIGAILIGMGYFFFELTGGGIFDP